MMNEILYLLIAFIVGLILGILFFGGLWFTVKKAVIAKKPAIWFFISFFLRMSIILIGFYYISLGSWQRLIVCLLGFIVARLAVTHFTKYFEIQQEKKKVYHEA